MGSLEIRKNIDKLTDLRQNLSVNWITAADQIKKIVFVHGWSPVNKGPVEYILNNHFDYHPYQFILNVSEVKSAFIVLIS